MLINAKLIKFGASCERDKNVTAFLEDPLRLFPPFFRCKAVMFSSSTTSLFPGNWSFPDFRKSWWRWWSVSQIDLNLLKSLLKAAEGRKFWNISGLLSRAVLHFREAMKANPPPLNFSMCKVFLLLIYILYTVKKWFTMLYNDRSAYS